MNRNQNPAARQQWAQHCRLRRMAAEWSAGYPPYVGSLTVWFVTACLSAMVATGLFTGRPVLYVATAGFVLLSLILLIQRVGRPHSWPDITAQELKSYCPADAVAFRELQCCVAETGHLTARVLSDWLEKERSTLTRCEYAFTSRQVRNDETEDIPYE
ncbi:hypothetical protein [Pantoea sp. At-9b]|uniref:hypothetical protein n=1 Tax=Pantoea sp. (strain At-9b) TaxID=592316 RepID=UPI0001B3EBC4|nr:hypothetical protein [Pantoea sp. At-9b]ADU72373.1 hypothetical protein Pat9b_5105 [Pantoea sp. At-9b]